MLYAGREPTISAAVRSAGTKAVQKFENRRRPSESVSYLLKNRYTSSLIGFKPRSIRPYLSSFDSVNPLPSVSNSLKASVRLNSCQYASSIFLASRVLDMSI